MAGVELAWLASGECEANTAGAGEFRAVSEHVTGRATMALGADYAAFAGELVSSQVNGDAMTPTINSGAAVVIDSGDLSIKDGKIYAIDISGQITIRRAQVTPQGVTFSADNSRYQSFNWSSDSNDARIVGRVAWVLQSV